MMEDLQAGDSFLSPIAEERSETSSGVSPQSTRRRLPETLSEYANSSTRANIDAKTAPSVISSAVATVAPDPHSTPKPSGPRPMKCRDFWTRRNVTFVVGACVLIVLVVAALVIVAEFAMDEKEEREPSISPSNPSPSTSTSPPGGGPPATTTRKPTAAPTSDSQLILVATIDAVLFNVSDPQVLLDPNSIQYQARYWMLHDDLIGEDVAHAGYQRIVQRYVMALLHFALTGFFQTGDECYWKGVECDDTDASVVTIRLKSSNLTGQIPTELKYLTTLTYINLSNNTISGHLPDMSNWSSLLRLDLSYNHFNGSIPWSAGLSNWSSLVRLDLSYNHLTGSIPSEIWSLAKLEYVYLNNNTLTGTVELAKDAKTMPDLKDIRLRGNELSGELPAWFFHLPSLSLLIAGGNHFTGQLPHNNDLPVGLSFLDLAFNSLTGPVPASLFQLADLTEVYLEHNALTGSLPSKITNTNMEQLWLRDNLLTGAIPDGFGQSWAHLTRLYLDGNQLTGQLGPQQTTLCTTVWPWLKSVTADCDQVTCYCCANCATR